MPEFIFCICGFRGLERGHYQPCRGTLSEKSWLWKVSWFLPPP